jgi:cytidylate kinase
VSAKPHIIVAIDGPAASGKSSVARALAKRLGFLYVNTGAMYRAFTWYVLEKKTDPHDASAVTELLKKMEMRCRVDRLEMAIELNGTAPTPHLAGDCVNKNVSAIASIAEVRRVLVATQRTFANEHDVVMEGRDIGSVVFPETPYKFYIDASVEVRARRRAAQGQHDEIAARDRQDSSRKTSPLILAEDAHVIDSSHLTIDGVVGEIVGRLKLKGMRIEE